MTRTARSLLAAVALLSATPALAEPGGCLKYGAVGAVGGHLAHHGVLGALGGCATGMYTRHKYRDGLRSKAALWDKEHPATDANASWWQRHHDQASVAQKAQWYDAEHPQGQTPGAPPPPPPHN